MSLTTLVRRYVDTFAALAVERGQITIEVKVVDVRKNFGRIEFEVEPLHGAGRAWVAHTKLSQMEPGPTPDDDILSPLTGR